MKFLLIVITVMFLMAFNAVYDASLLAMMTLVPGTLGMILGSVLAVTITILFYYIEFRVFVWWLERN